MIKAGNTTPIKPLDSTAKPQKAQPATSHCSVGWFKGHQRSVGNWPDQRACGSGCSSARARHSTAAVSVPATSMSWLAYWPPMK